MNLDQLTSPPLDSTSGLKTLSSVTGNSGPSARDSLFTVKNARLVASLAAIYACVACSAEGLPVDGTTSTGGLNLNLPTVDTANAPEVRAPTTPDINVVVQIVQGPVTGGFTATQVPQAPEGPYSPFKPVSVDPTDPPAAANPEEPAPVEPEGEDTGTDTTPEPPTVVEAEPEAPTEPEQPKVVEAETEEPAEPEQPKVVEAEPEEPPVDNTPDQPPLGAAIPGLGSRTSSFEQIAASGLDNACYIDEDHYIAEFMMQNPDACFWEVDSANRTVTALDTPTPPANAVLLPPPSGVNDTGMLESFINARAGESLVGQGVYKVSDLDINVPVDIFNMPMEPVSGAREMVMINSPDVRIFNSPIDAKGSSTVYTGFHAIDGSHRFTLVDSGFSNILHKKDANATGVYLRGVDDFHIACNTFENIINDTNNTVTARANSIWMNGRKTQSTSGGFIVNNYAFNHQSNGKLKDSEFFTQQGYASTSVANPVKIFGNTTIDAGKRFTKHQEDNAVVLSNYHEWTEKSGPLGNRLLLAHSAVQFSDNVIIRNNRVKISAGSRFDYVFTTQVQYGTRVQDNIHFDCNDIEITDKLSATSNSVPQIIAARMPTKPENSTGFEATNSSANYNKVHGDGSVRFFYNFDEGYDDRGGPFQTVGNVFEIDYLNAVYK